MKANNRLKSRMKKLRGTIRSKGKNGNLYYRLTIASGLRKEFPLKTKDEAEAVKKAEELDSIWTAPTLEVAAPQINVIKGFNKVQLNLDFSEAYQKYLEHPGRACPHTIAEQNSYFITIENGTKDTLASLWRHDDRLLVVVSNLSKEARELTITLKGKCAGFKNAANAEWFKNRRHKRRHIPLKNDQMKIKLAAKDYILVEVTR